MLQRSSENIQDKERNVAEILSELRAEVSCHTSAAAIPGQHAPAEPGADQSHLAVGHINLPLLPPVKDLFAHDVGNFQFRPSGWTESFPGALQFPTHRVHKTTPMPANLVNLSGYNHVPNTLHQDYITTSSTAFYNREVDLEHEAKKRKLEAETTDWVKPPSTSNLSSIPHIQLQRIITASVVPDLAKGKRFKSFFVLIDMINRFGSCHGFRVGRSTHSLKFADAKKFFNIPHTTAHEYEKDKNCTLPSRGWFYCINGGKACPFRIHFCFHHHDVEYEIVEFKEEHNHEIAIPEPLREVSVGGKADLASGATDLTALERETIVAARPFMDADHLLKLLKIHFPDRVYSSDMIAQLRNESASACHKQDLNELIKMGSGVQLNGGLFEISFDSDCKLSQLHFQSLEMKQIAEVYNDFVEIQMNAISSMPAYVCLSLNIVDCFGERAISGLSLLATKSFENALETLKLFGLYRKGGTLFTIDSRREYVATAALGELKHVISTTSISKALKDFNSSANSFPEKSKFLKSVGRVLDASLTPESCDELIDELKQMAHCSSAAETLIGSIDSDKAALCATFKNQVFLANRDLVLGSNPMNDEIIDDLHQHVRAAVAESRKSPDHTLLNTKPFVTPFVKKHLKSQSAAALRFPKTLAAVETSESWSTYSINDPSNSIEHTVKVNDHLHECHCNCFTFISSRLPCAAMIHVLSTTKRVDGVTGANDYLVPRWRLDRHPRYQLLISEKDTLTK